MVARLYDKYHNHAGSVAACSFECLKFNIFTLCQLTVNSISIFSRLRCLRKFREFHPTLAVLH